MLELLAIYFIGKSFYDLALKYEKNKWVFAIIGAVTYFASLFLVGLIIGMLSVTSSFNLNNVSDIVLSLIAIPVGILFCVILYQILKSAWKKQAMHQQESSELLDEDLIR
ncbi:MAG: hypothetical protein ACPG21_10570 [Crocinitomicaceae bacterium]